MNYWILYTPQYHALMAILAIIVIALVIIVWCDIKRQQTRDHQVLVALCKLNAALDRKVAAIDVIVYLPRPKQKANGFDANLIHDGRDFGDEDHHADDVVRSCLGT